MAELSRSLKTAAVVFGGLVAALGLAYGSFCLKRPARTPAQRSLFQGIEYERFARDSPRPLMFHIVTVDLTAAGIEFLVTPQQKDPGGKETLADTVPGFLQKHGVQVAINGSFFYPMHVHHPFDYAPRVGEGVNAVGVTISEGDRYSAAQTGWAALCIVSPREMTIEESGDCPAETVQGLAGDRQFIKNGQVVAKASHQELFPRTVVALDKAGETMWLVAVDGRQFGYSEGITLTELAAELTARGAYQALNLDGGGSTTLAVEAGSQPTVLNSPIQARVPTHLRPVANHLGIYADDVSE